MAHPAISTAGLDSDILAVTSAAPVKRISWAAVFAGFILAMVVQLSLSLLGASIGMST